MLHGVSYLRDIAVLFKMKQWVLFYLQNFDTIQTCLTFSGCGISIEI